MSTYDSVFEFEFLLQHIQLSLTVHFALVRGDGAEDDDSQGGSNSDPNNSGQSTADAKHGLVLPQTFPPMHQVCARVAGRTSELTCISSSVLFCQLSTGTVLICDVTFRPYWKRYLGDTW